MIQDNSKYTKLKGQKYLGSGLIKGIGPIYAKRIVSVFGEKTLDVIETLVEKLLVVEGIGKQRVAMIAKAWSEQKEIREVMMFLQSHGISSAYATKIYKKYGNESIAFIRENPYRFAYDITGIGFVTADKVAQKLGFDATSPLRAEAGILFVLQGFLRYRAVNNSVNDTRTELRPYEGEQDDNKKSALFPA